MKEVIPIDAVSAPATTERCRTASVSRVLGYLGLLTATVTVPAVLVTDRLASEKLNTVVFSLLISTVVLALAAILYGLLSRFIIARVPWPLHGKAAANDGIHLGLICFIAVILNLMAIPSFVRARCPSSEIACHAYLRQMEVARQQWLQERKRALSDKMSWEDIVGPGKAFAYTPTCPAGGTYTLGGSTSKPTCTVQWHTLRER